MPQRRSTTALALATGTLLAIVAGCGADRPAPPPGLDEVQLAGWRAYVDLNCAACHGEDRRGQRSGPALTGLAEHWSAEQLVSYLTDPDAMIRTSPRLARVAGQYSIRMPASSGKSPGYGDPERVERLGALAEYLLVDPR